MGWVGRALCRAAEPAHKPSRFFASPFLQETLQTSSTSPLSAFCPGLGAKSDTSRKCGSHFLSVLEREAGMRESCLVAQGGAGGKTAVFTQTHRGFICLC